MKSSLKYYFKIKVISIQSFLMAEHIRNLVGFYDWTLRGKDFMAAVLVDELPCYYTGKLKQIWQHACT